MLLKVQEDASSVLDREQIRKQIADNLSIPMQRMKIKGLEKSSEDGKRYVLCYVENIAQQLLDTINTNLPDEINVLSSRSYVDDLNDVIISDVIYEGSEMSLEGSCMVEVHFEYDGDDMGDWEFPSKFKVKLSYDEATQMYSIIDGKFDVNTDSFYGNSEDLL